MLVKKEKMMYKASLKSVYAANVSKSTPSYTLSLNPDTDLVKELINPKTKICPEKAMNEC